MNFNDVKAEKFRTTTIDRRLQGFFDAAASGLSFGLGGQLCKIVGLAFRDVVLALLERLLGLVPALLGDLLRCLLGVAGVGTDGGMGFLVEGFNL